MSDHKDIPDPPLLEYHPHALQDDDLNNIFDQSNHDHDHSLESTDALFTGEDSRSDNEDEDNDLPAAFHKHPAICNAYIHVFLLASLKGSTHAAVQIHLEGIIIGLRAAEAQSPDVSFDELDRMACTLTTAEKRLGISTNKFITSSVTYSGNYATPILLLWCPNSG